MAEEYYTDIGDPSTNVSAFIVKQLMSTLDDDTYFTLESQSITSLDILPKLKPDLTPDNTTAGGLTSRSNTTVFAVLNKCRTVTGQRLLALWLKNPLVSKEKIQIRQDIVKFLADNAELRLVCYDDYLRKIPDLLRLSFKISKEKCSITDLVKVYYAVKSAYGLCRTYIQMIKIAGTPENEAIGKLFHCLKSTCDELNEYMTLIENTIDLDNVDEFGEYIVKPNSDENIARLTFELGSINDQARRELASVADDIGLEAGKNLKLESDAEKGFLFKVTKNNEQAVRGNNKYEQVGTVKNDGYRFTNKALTRLSAKYINAREEYNSLAKDVILDIISKATVFESEIVEFSITLTLIDVFVALSVAAVNNRYVKPLLLDADSGRMCLERMRHPCIENQPDVENYVPNDLLMSKDEKKFYIITGPNMGGKSTFIKSIAVNVIMAQCGSMIPADDARISIIDGVYTRVGAGDRQMDGISTFMGEMMDMSIILKKATENSLVIIDELGRGTSTFDGFGLAWSISKRLATINKCYTLFATHYHELTEMEEEIQSVGNLHVKAVCQGDKLTMLFDIGAGVCEESYGINVARYTQFPKHVIESAKDKLKQFEEVPGFQNKKEVREFVRECVREITARNVIKTT